MELNRLDWNKAQNLLLTLVQVLSPWTEKEKLHPISILINKRFFHPQCRRQNSENLHNPIRLLTILHSAQTLISDLTEETKSPPKPSLLIGAKSEQPNGAENRDKKSLDVNFIRDKKIFAITQPYLEPKESIRLIEKGRREGLSNDPKLQKYISIQAKRLVDQVRIAIKYLANSNSFTSPKKEALQSVLTHLKPMVEEFAKSIEEGNQKMGILSKFTHHRILEHEKSTNEPQNRTLLVRTKIFEKGESPHQEISAPSKITTTQREQPLVTSDKLTVTQEQNLEPIVPKFERSSLPLAPFVTFVNPITSAKKGKKKRKGPFSRQDDEEKER